MVYCGVTMGAIDWLTLFPNGLWQFWKIYKLSNNVGQLQILLTVGVWERMTQALAEGIGVTVLFTIRTSVSPPSGYRYACPTHHCVAVVKVLSGLLEIHGSHGILEFVFLPSLTSSIDWTLSCLHSLASSIILSFRPNLSYQNIVSVCKFHSLRL